MKGFGKTTEGGRGGDRQQLEGFEAFNTEGHLLFGCL